MVTLTYIRVAAAPVFSCPTVFSCFLAKSPVNYCFLAKSPVNLLFFAFSSLDCTQKWTILWIVWISKTKNVVWICLVISFGLISVIPKILSVIRPCLRQPFFWKTTVFSCFLVKSTGFLLFFGFASSCFLPKSTVFSPVFSCFLGLLEQRPPCRYNLGQL